METYSPFNRRIDDLTLTDIASLRTVHEGWYIEYKRDLGNASTIAKSIAAFANTYGGWLFYGIDEKSKAEPVAGAFPGIDIKQLDAALQTIRHAAASHLMPPPHFETKVIPGPAPELALPDGRAIVVVHVPWGPAAPYVHKDGRIFRRVNDGSDPRPESDRFVLDQLWRRADDIKNRYAHWVDSDPILSHDEQDAPYLRILIVADLWEDHGLNANLRRKDIHDIFGSVDGNFALPFDTIYSSATGFVCRQTANNKPQKQLLTWRFRNDLRSEIILPLSRFEPASLFSRPDGYAESRRFLNLLEAQRYVEPTVIDLNLVFLFLLGVMRTQKKLSARASWHGPHYVKMKLVNVWHTIPFLDISSTMDDFERHGIPLCLDDEITLYPGSQPRSFIKLPEQAELTEEAHRLHMAYFAFSPLATAFGISPGLDDDGALTADSISNFAEAGIRALDIQRRGSAITASDDHYGD